MELASIIVPIYNTEKFLNRCIESLINQTYTKLQIILVDDGSKDNSLEICKDYEKKYSFIEVYHQNNQGVSAARNEGLKHLKGKYVFFVDSDDYILPEYIEHFMEMPESSFIGGGYIENDTNGWKYKVEECILSMKEYKKDCRFTLAKIPSVHVHGNRYLSSVILKNNLLFDVNSKCGEDLRFNVAYFLCIDELRATERCEYIYCIRKDSAIHQFHEDRLREEKEECMLREKIFGDSYEFQWIRYIHWHITLDHLYFFSKQNSLAKLRLKEAVKDRYFRQCIGYSWKNGTKDMKIFSVCVKLGTFNLYKNIMYVWGKINQLRSR